MNLINSYLHSPASQSTPHLYISALATKIERSIDLPRPWAAHFSGLPKVKFAGTDAGALFTIPVEESICSVAFSPDGRLVVSGSQSGSIQIWDASMGEERNSLKGHTKRVPVSRFPLHEHKLSLARQTGLCGFGMCLQEKRSRNLAASEAQLSSSHFRLMGSAFSLAGKTDMCGFGMRVQARPWRSTP